MEKTIEQTIQEIGQIQDPEEQGYMLRGFIKNSVSESKGLSVQRFFHPKDGHKILLVELHF